MEKYALKNMNDTFEYAREMFMHLLEDYNLCAYCKHQPEYVKQLWNANCHLVTADKIPTYEEYLAEWRIMLYGSGLQYIYFEGTEISHYRFCIIPRKRDDKMVWIVRRTRGKNPDIKWHSFRMMQHDPFEKVDRIEGMFMSNYEAYSYAANIQNAEDESAIQELVNLTLMQKNQHIFVSDFLRIVYKHTEVSNYDLSIACQTAEAYRRRYYNLSVPVCYADVKQIVLEFIEEFMRNVSTTKETAIFIDRNAVYDEIIKKV